MALFVKILRLFRLVMQSNAAPCRGRQNGEGLVWFAALVCQLWPVLCRSDRRCHIARKILRTGCLPHSSGVLGTMTTHTSMNSFFVFSTYFYLSLGTQSIISTPNQWFSTSDLEFFTNRPRENLENLYPTSHSHFLPNFLQFTPTASRSLSRNLILTTNFTHYILYY